VSAGAPDVVLVTGEDMPHPDTESPLILAALARLGVRGEVRPWTSEAEWSDVALAVCRSTWDYFYRPHEFLAWVDAVGAQTRLENPPALLRWNAHKSYLLELAGDGVPLVPTVLVPRGAGAEERAAALDRFDTMVIKPAVGGGAMGAARGERPALEEHLHGLTQTGEALVQPLIASVLSRGETSLFYFGGQLSHAVRKVAKAGDFRVQPIYGGRVEAHEPTEAELAVADAVFQALPAPPLYARIDLVQSAEEPLLMEAELIEPFLFLDAAPGAETRLAEVLASQL
jgi:glutathione synthase/RimK-type ligase-like ATP-grasp enzyme